MANITVSSGVHEFMQAADAAAARSALSLGDSAIKNVGTGASQVAAGDHTHEGTAILSTGEVGGTKFLREDGDGTCSWQAIAGGGVLGITIDGAGSAITTGTKGYLFVPYACTITAAEIVADQSGSIVIDVWKDTYANFPPVDADSITASAPPTLSSAQKSTDATLSGWTATLAEGDYLAFNVDSAATVTRVTLALKVTRTI